MQEKDDPGNYIWVFQKKTIRIMLEDMRESVKVDREWCDEVSWIHNWALGISLATKNSTEADYQNWIALISLLSTSHGATYLHFDEGSGDPTTRWRISDFLGIPVLHSEEGSSAPPQRAKMEAKPEPEPVEEFDDEPQPQPVVVEEDEDAGNDLQALIRKELAKQGLVAPGEKPPLQFEPVMDEGEDDEDDEESFDGYDDWDFE